MSTTFAVHVACRKKEFAHSDAQFEEHVAVYTSNWNVNIMTEPIHMALHHCSEENVEVGNFVVIILHDPDSSHKICPECFCIDERIGPRVRLKVSEDVL